MLFKKFDKTMEEVKAQLDAHISLQLVDVRFEEEYVEGHIPGAILLPLPEVEISAEKILPDKNALIYIYCRSGQRASKAVYKLRQMEYTNVYNIGGINLWQYEIEKGK